LGKLSNALANDAKGNITLEIELCWLKEPLQLPFTQDQISGKKGDHETPERFTGFLQRKLQRHAPMACMSWTATVGHRCISIAHVLIKRDLFQTIATAAAKEVNTALWRANPRSFSQLS